ncbi:HAD family phosphatase, partial [Candidatus Woesebacteria bacterium]|nr:HAD family phosphatase [Candidatus Woesebacteria bacterium]
MRIEAIVSDFDGTLIGGTQELAPEGSEAIKHYIANGGRFSIATGRAYEGLLERVCADLGLDSLQIVRGGSEIVDSRTGKVVWGKYIDPLLVDNVINDLKVNPNLIVFAESGPDLYTIDGQSDPEFATGANVKDLKTIDKNNVPKIAIPPLYVEDKIIPIYEAIKEKYPTLHIVRTTSRKGMGIDVNDGGAGKHSALLEYSKLTGIDPVSILGLGDSYNDYPLLSACGVKVAMGNAPQELKDLADHVVGTQEENGIIDAIK